jgi:hypothetical protein
MSSQSLVFIADDSFPLHRQSSVTIFHITCVVNGAQARHSMAKGGTAASLDETDSSDRPEDDLQDDELPNRWPEAEVDFRQHRGPKADPLAAPAPPNRAVLG